METITLPESELAEMKQFYHEEHEKTIRRLQHIRNMLKHLGENADSSGKKSPDTDAPSNTLSVKSELKTRKKAGRKSKWEMLIMKRLRQLDRPVTYEELTEEIIAFTKIPQEKHLSTKQALVNVIFRLRSRDKKLDTFSMGKREKYIALKAWFEKPGIIKKEYAAKVNLPESKIKKNKVGRPPKNTT